MTSYHMKLMELSDELISHGWGELKFTATSMKDNSVKIEINCGKSYVYFVKKEIPFNQNIL